MLHISQFIFTNFYTQLVIGPEKKRLGFQGQFMGSKVEVTQWRQLKSC